MINGLLKLTIVNGLEFPVAFFHALLQLSYRRMSLMERFHRSFIICHIYVSATMNRCFQYKIHPHSFVTVNFWHEGELDLSRNPAMQGTIPSKLTMLSSLRK
jgi:hypothetical protein